MKLKEILLGAFLLCNYQLTNSVNAAFKETTIAPTSSSNLFLAQITPDETLGDENSTVVPDSEVEGVPAELIEGGAERGTNLFHSFEEFNVDDGQSVYFANPEGIANIFSRVTGGDVSDILGTLGVDGGADLFLLNPNGIIFGENASLDVNGSFTASTANSLVFDNHEFDATDPDVPPLLTVNMPVGLNLGNNSGDIVNRSTVEDSEANRVGLSVTAGNNLSFVGGNLRLEGGKVTARGGRIELGSLSAAGTVGIAEDGSLTFPEDVAKADITLSDGAVVNVRGTGGGNIAINARNLGIIGDNSSLEAGVTADSTSNNARAGDIEINLTDNLTLDAGVITNIVASQAVGNAGDVDITTGSMKATNRGFISAGTRGQGNAGDIEITATEDIILNDSINDRFISNVNSRVEQEGMGDAGDITIDAANLSLTGGGIDVITSGEGDAGNIEITATEDININSNGFNNGILSVVNQGGVGNAGKINISTSNLSLTGGGAISTATLDRGNAGDIEITATESVFIRAGETLASGIYTNALNDTGNGGNVDIVTERLTIENGGAIEVGNIGLSDILDNLGLLNIIDPGTGEPGNIRIEANFISLNDEAKIEAVTRSQTNDTANINLQVAEEITLENNSLISAQALENANGGNLDIDTEFIVAAPSSNSDIIANAERGQGGSIEINAKSIFGIEERFLDDVTNDINASSEFGLSGTVEIDILEVDPSRDSLDVSVAPVETEVAQICDRNNENKSGLVVTGRGGLPNSPEANLNGGFVLEDWRSDREHSGSDTRLSDDLSQDNRSQTEPIVEADRWIVNQQGKVVLVAANSSGDLSNRMAQQSTDCRTN